MVRLITEGSEWKKRKCKDCKENTIKVTEGKRRGEVRSANKTTTIAAAASNIVVLLKYSISVEMQMKATPA